MAAPLVTVTRQFASGGSDIAALAASQLGWTLIDNQFVEEVARQAGLPREEVAQRAERAPGLLERLARTLAVASPEMFITTAGVPRVEEDEGEIVKITERVIREAAGHGRVVLVGHGAQAVLAQRDSTLHVFVVASKPWRVKQAIERMHVEPTRAEKTVDETDLERDRYVKTYYGRTRQDAANYDLVVNGTPRRWDLRVRPM
jgi:cytidylate kinase